MKALHKFLCFTAVVASAATYSFAASVRDVSEASQKPSLIMPQSFETDTHKMLEDWYLKNYAALDYEADDYNGDEVSDEILVERLGKLPTLIEMPLNTPVRNAINFYANRRRQLVENMLGLSLYYMPIFEDALERNGLPLELRYLPVVESALVPTAVSRVGAAGLWQFMPATGKSLGLEVSSLVDQRRDPYLSSEAGARYLKQLYNTFGDWSLAIAAYNCGPGNVNKALRRAGDGKHDFWEIYPFLPAETRNYVPSFIAANYIMTYYKDHDISPALARRPLITDTVHVSRRVHLEQISEVMDIPMDELRALNPQFRADIIPGDIRPYALVLPSLQAYAYVANEDSIVNHNADKYSRRSYVEPASGKIKGTDARGEYYDEEVIVYHKVRKGETIASIAKKYGVSASDIRKLNKVGKRLKTGKKLKIKTVQRHYKPAPVERPQDVNADKTIDTTEVVVADSAIVVGPDSIAPTDDAVQQQVASAFSSGKAEKDSVKKEAPAKVEKKKSSKNVDKGNTDKKKNKKKPANITHKVRKGESLGKIARRYGVTVSALRKANGISGDRIDVGQTLKIPQK